VGPSRDVRRRSAVVGADATDEPVSVVVVDDQEVFRQAARRLIAATPGFEQVGEAASGEEALEIVGALRPDLLLLDVRMPGMDGIETLEHLASVRSSCVVVLISVEPMADLPPPAGVVPHLLKHELSPAALRDVWGAHGGTDVRG
jgi:CheY-like chemotaxis protein